ncbi:MAG: hypothetical protein HY286_04535 [Planctomycetes bacterium]|nr:hypothetical protein [Planctomycetota bacterium]
MISRRVKTWTMWAVVPVVCLLLIGAILCINGIPDGRRADGNEPGETNHLLSAAAATADAGALDINNTENINDRAGSRAVVETGETPRPRAEAIFDPNTYNPIDRETVDRFRRDLSAVELGEKVASTDARARIAARDALKLDRARRIPEIENYLLTVADANLANRRMLAIQAAGALGYSQFKNSLQTVATKDAVASVRAAAFVALGSLADESVRVCGLRDADWPVRNCALSTLDSVKLPKQQIALAVVDRLADEKPLVRTRAATLLARWTGRSPADLQQNTEVAAAEMRAWAESLPRGTPALR